MQSEDLFELHYKYEDAANKLSHKITQEGHNSTVQDIMNFSIYQDMNQVMLKELSARQNVHDVHIEEKTKTLGGYIFEKTPCSEEQAHKTLHVLKESISKRLEIVQQSQLPDFKKEKRQKNRGRIYATPNEAMRLTKALAFLEGDMIKSESKIDIETTEGKKQITIAQLIASTISSLDNPKISWQEGLDNPDERKKYFTDRMIDTLYENQRAHNMMDDESQHIMDDMDQNDKISCLGGAANRVVMLASMFVKTDQEELPIPSQGDYAKKVPDIAQKVLADAKPEDFSDEQRLVIEDAVNSKESEDIEMTEELLKIFSSKIQENLKQEFPALLQTTNKSLEKKLWEENRDNLQYVDIPDALVKNFAKKEQLSSLA